MRLAAEIAAIASSLDREFIHHFWVKFKCRFWATRHTGGRDGIAESAAIEVLKSNAAAVRAPTATGRPDLAMVPTMRCQSAPAGNCPGEGVFGRRFLSRVPPPAAERRPHLIQLLPEAQAADSDGYPAQLFPSGRDHRVSGRLHGRRRRGPMPRWLVHKQFAYEAHR